MTNSPESFPRFNEYFASVEEARLIWAMYQMALHGIDSAIPPFPGDRPQVRKPISATGRGLFDSLRDVDLAEYASRFTQLHPSGLGKWRGLCPIHEERTGSFYVYANPWRWICFGACATGGDIVALARELKNVGARK